MAAVASCCATLVLPFGAPIVNSVIWLALALYLIEAFARWGWSSRNPPKFVVAYLVVYSALHLITILWQNLQSPHEWDFLAKFFEGVMATNGINPYAAGSYQQALEISVTPILPSETFRQEIFDVGFKYLPPFLFLVLPIGLMSYDHGQIFWFVLHTILLLIAAGIASRLFIVGPENPRLRLGLYFSFIVIFPPTKGIFYLAQTHFFILPIVFLAAKALDHRQVAPLVALTACVKPFGIFLGLVYLVRRQWSAIVFGLLTLTLAFAATAAVFGGGVLLDFVLHNPNAQIPTWLYSEPANQSLSAVLLRNLPLSLPEGSPLGHPVIFGSLLFFLAGGVAAAHLMPATRFEWAYAVLVVTAVLVYPGALLHYSIYLLLPIFLILSADNGMFASVRTKAIFVATILLTLRVSPFSANLFAWLCMVVAAFDWRRRESAH
jgi:hypothetical protein